MPVAWLRIIFAEGPRQVINALTLYSVMEANLVPVGEHAALKGHSPIIQFFTNIKILANHNKQQAVVLFGMLFTLIIWVITALGLAIAGLSYIMFLWHYIPKADSGLSGYCRRKVDSRLQKIVGVKVNKALAKGNNARTIDSLKVLKAGVIPAQVVRQPTLPIINAKENDEPLETQLSRQTTQSTLPLYTSRQPSANGDYSDIPKDGELGIFPLPRRPMPPSRSTTQSSSRSDVSYVSNAPLIGEAAEMGYGAPPRPYSPAGISRMNSDHKTIISTQDRSFIESLKGPQQSFNNGRKPLPVRDQAMPSSLQIRPPTRQNGDRENAGVNISRWHSPTQYHAISPGLYELPIDDAQRRAPERSATRQIPVQEYEMHTQRSGNEHHQVTGDKNYVAFDPTIHASESKQRPLRAIPPASRPPPVRNFTMPIKTARAHTPQAQQPALPIRSGTAPTSQGSSYFGPPPPHSGTASVIHRTLQ